MEISRIYEEIKENLRKLEPCLAEQEKKLAECEKIAEEALLAVDAAERKRNEIRAQFEALNKAMDALTAGGFPLEKAEEVKEVKTEEVKEVKKKKPEQIIWTKKGGTLVRYDRNGRELEHYVSQKAAARDLNWDQSSVSKFIRLRPEQQIAKKGFYFKWIP